MPDVSIPIEPIPYATPLSFQPARRSPRLHASVWLGMFGLALIFAAGCFMIGILAVSNTDMLNASPTGLAFFIISLYLMAFACFGIALLMVVRGVRTLFKIVTG